MRVWPILLVFVLLYACAKEEVVFTEKDFTQYVNPFIGTDGTGHTFPGPCLPFGMVQPGPDNRNGGWDYTSGYQYRDSLIMGFSQTRASGTGIGEFGDILLLPYQDNEPGDFRAEKSDEVAEVGYYGVKLDDQIEVALTCTERVAFHQYHYTSETANVHLNLQHGIVFLTDSLVLDSEVEIDWEGRRISGYAHTRNWVERKYFYTILFDQEFQEVKPLPRAEKENAPKYNLSFHLPEKVLKVKIALSSVSVEGAKKNMETELPGWDFAKTRAEAKANWNTYLSKIQIDAPLRQMEIFYTAMYHLFIHPSNIADVDGQYRGVDDQIGRAGNGEYYSTLSLWDTYRGVHPLFTLLVPERVPGFVNTMLAHHRAQGFLPIWTAWGQENYCMIGNHAIPVIVDAMSKDFSGFSYDDAMVAMMQSTQENHLNSNWEVYDEFGYYPYDLLKNESVSRTLESGFDDYSVAIAAQKMGWDTVSEPYFARASYYQNLFDPGTGLMRGKDAAGNFRTPFDPLTPTSPMNNPGDYTEANAWQYSWASTQHDVDGLIELLGGVELFTEHLNKFFTIVGEGDNKHLGQEAMIGQYAHGNEPSHHIAYLYAYSSQPEQGLALLKQIYHQFYDNTPKGITGNDDCGQMSAWYIFTTLGFYPVNPANGTFIVGEPQVDYARLRLPEGRVLEIEKKERTSDLPAIDLNGASVERMIKYEDLTEGGKLTFQ